MFSNTIRKWKDQPFQQAKGLVKTLGWMFVIIIIIIMFVSNIWFVIANANDFENRISFDYDYDLFEGTYYLDFNFTLQLDNPTFMSISNSYLKLDFANETDNYQLNLINIPKISPNSHLNYTFNFHIDNDTISEFHNIANILANATQIGFELRIGLFWSYIYAEGIIKNITFFGGF